MAQFSANLGYLFTELPLADAIRASADTGFTAVEFHWPGSDSTEDIKQALSETGLPLLSINTPRGDVKAGEFVFAAMMHRGPEARVVIGETLTLAAELGAQNVHILAGIADGADALDVYSENLAFAAEVADPLGLGILIEPLNPVDVPGYFLSNPDQAIEVIEALKDPSIGVMFDCYHIAKMGRDVIAEFHRCKPYIGHVQFAGVPDRGPPDQGSLNYQAVFEALDAAGWDRPLGAEYRPPGETGQSLGWINSLT